MAFARSALSAETNSRCVFTTTLDNLQLEIDVGLLWCEVANLKQMHIGLKSGLKTSDVGEAVFTRPRQH